MNLEGLGSNLIPVGYTLSSPESCSAEPSSNSDCPPRSSAKPAHAVCGPERSLKVADFSGAC